MFRGENEPQLKRWETDGDLVAYRVSAATSPHAAVLLIHGFATHAGRHATKLHVLAERGIECFAYDLRGHGHSPGPRALVERFDSFVDDSLAMRERVQAAVPGLPFFLLAESMGGLLAVRSAQRRPAGLAGLVLTAPALAIGDDIPAPLRSVAKFLGEIAPSLPAGPLDAKALSRSPGIAESFLSDPLTHHGPVPLRTAAEMVSHGRAALSAAAAWRIPTLIVHGDADRIVPLRGSQRFAADAVPGTVELRVIPGGYHETLHDPGGEQLFEDIATWIDAIAAGSPLAK
jgi:acylglycerol lipase